MPGARTTSWIAAGMLSGLFLGCEPGARPAGDGAVGETAPPVASSSETGVLRHTGRVVVSRSSEGDFTTLYVAGGAIGLMGELLPELNRLPGAKVTVEGALATHGAWQAIAVSSYELLEINGERPWTGVLGRSQGAYVLDAPDDTLRGAPIPLARLPGFLAGQLGAVIWVIGTPQGNGLEVRAAGVIRPP